MVIIMDEHGKLLDKIGKRGGGDQPGEFMLPGRMAVRDEELFVIDVAPEGKPTPQTSKPAAPPPSRAATPAARPKLTVSGAVARNPVLGSVALWHDVNSKNRSGVDSAEACYL